MTDRYAHPKNADTSGERRALTEITAADHRMVNGISAALFFCLIVVSVLALVMFYHPTKAQPVLSAIHSNAVRI